MLMPVGHATARGMFLWVACVATWDHVDIHGHGTSKGCVWVCGPTEAQDSASEQYYKMQDYITRNHVEIHDPCSHWL